MKTIAALLYLFTISSFAFAQPELEAWMLNTSGTFAEYDTTPAPGGLVVMDELADVTEVCFDLDYVYIVCEGLASYTMGPWSNPNVPIAQGFTFRINRNPVKEEGMPMDQPKGGIGVAINGVKLYGYTDDKSYDPETNSDQPTPVGDDIWHSDAWYNEGSTMDVTGAGHPDGAGIYHHHATPKTLYTFPSTEHSPIVGYMFDGFPIYGPFGYSDSIDTGSSIVRIETSYQIRDITERTILPDGSPSIPAGPIVTGDGSFDIGHYVEDYEYIPGFGHLDRLNGRWCKTPEYPAGTYAYFVTTDAVGDPAFPYFIGAQYYGEAIPADVGANSGTATIPGAANCNVSIEEYVSTAALEIYPNPSKDEINLSHNIEGEVTLTVTAMDGKVLLNEIQNTTTQITLDFSSYAPGIYLISIKNGNDVVTKRVIKN